MVNLKTWILICLLFAFSSEAMADSIKGQGQLNDIQLSALLSDDFEFIVETTSTAYFRFSADGTWYGTFQEVEGQGRWSIKDARVCSQQLEGSSESVQVPWGETYCFGVERREDRLYFYRSTGLEDFEGKEISFEDFHLLARLDSANQQLALEQEEKRKETDSQQFSKNPNRYRPLTGRQIRSLLENLRGVHFSGVENSSLRKDWIVSFSRDGSWEGRLNRVGLGGDDSWGAWEIEGDRLCVTKVSGGIPYNIIFEDCFGVAIDQTGGTIAAVFLKTDTDRLILKQRAFSDFARLQSSPEKPKSVAQGIGQPSASGPAAQKADQIKTGTKGEERKLETLRLEVELERLRQRRTMANKTDSPVIHSPKTLETREGHVTIRGFAKDDIFLVRLELDGKRIDTNNGQFVARVPVKMGKNEFRLAAFDSEGNKTQHLVTVTRRRNIPDIDFGNYHALVIGINNYEALPKLNTAIADAQVVAKTLEELYGFNVKLLQDPSRAEIIDVLDEYRDTLTEQDNLLIYYAGHGWLDQQSKTGYWLPVNAKSDRRSRWLSNATLTSSVQSFFAKHVMVVADSCYSGTLTRSIKVPERDPAYIARMAKKRTRVVLSSGGLEPVADSGGGRHSVFATQFLKELHANEGVLDGTRMFERVRKNVVLNADQTPEYSDIRLSGHEGGDFLFVRKN